MIFYIVDEVRYIQLKLIYVCFLYRRFFSQVSNGRTDQVKLRLSYQINEFIIAVRVLKKFGWHSAGTSPPGSLLYLAYVGVCY